MEAMRQSWTDERLDDFRAETARNFGAVDKRFDRVERRMESGFQEMRAEFKAMNERFDTMNERFDTMNERFDTVNERFDVMYRMMFRFCVLAMTTLFGALVTLVATLV
jgi:hypothetical protein